MPKGPRIERPRGKQPEAEITLTCTCGARRQAINPRWIRWARRSAGWSQEELGRKAEETQNKVSRLERGAEHVGWSHPIVRCLLGHSVQRSDQGFG